MLKAILKTLEASWFIALVLLLVTGAFRMLHQRGHDLVSGVPDVLVEVVGAVLVLASIVLVIALLSPPIRMIYGRFARRSAD